jgi:hypothetical protein
MVRSIETETGDSKARDGFGVAVALGETLLVSLVQQLF